MSQPGRLHRTCPNVQRSKPRGGDFVFAVCFCFAILLAAVSASAQRKPPALPAPQVKTRVEPKTPPAPTKSQAAADAEADAIVKAEKALDARDYATATAMLRERVAAGSTNYRVYFDLGYASTMSGDIPAAIDAYRKALELNSSLTQANVNLAILLMDQKRAAEAVPLLDRVVVERPKDAHYVVMLAEALNAGGNTARAAEEYRNAIALDPKSPDAHVGLGRLLAAGRQFDEAVKQLRRASELQPDNIITRLEIGGVLEAAGRADEARALYEDLAAKNPGNAVAHRRLARLWMTAGKFDQAAAELETAGKLTPQASDERELAIAYARARRPDAAIPHLRKLAASTPGDYDMRLLLGQMLMQQRQFADAQQELQAAAALRPDVPDAWVDLANDVYLQQNYPATVTILDRLSKMGHETPWLHFLRAISLDKLGQARPAMQSYQKFLEVAGGKYPDQEFQARQRVKVLKLVIEKGGGK